MGGVLWQIQYSALPCAVFATRPHPLCYILSYNTCNSALTSISQEVVTTIAGVSPKGSRAVLLVQNVFDVVDSYKKALMLLTKILFVLYFSHSGENPTIV